MKYLITYIVMFLAITTSVFAQAKECDAQVKLENIKKIGVKYWEIEFAISVASCSKHSGSFDYTNVMSHKHELLSKVDNEVWTNVSDSEFMIKTHHILDESIEISNVSGISLEYCKCHASEK